MKRLDNQLCKYSAQLKNDVGVSDKYVSKIGSTIMSELSALSKKQIENITNHSPVDLTKRYDELVAFQQMMDFIRSNQIEEPGLIRSQVISQNYICFVYLKDSYFRALQKETIEGTIINSCCKFMTSNRIRKFRNSIAHGNWNYKSDFSGLEYWDYLDGKRINGYEKLEIKQEELSFWQTLSRVIAYSSIETIRKKPVPNKVYN